MILHLIYNIVIVIMGYMNTITEVNATHEEVLMPTKYFLKMSAEAKVSMDQTQKMNKRATWPSIIHNSRCS